MGEFPSGQRGQTVNLLRFASMVRIRPPPPQKDQSFRIGLFVRLGIWRADSKGRSKQTVRWTVCPAVAFPQKSESVLPHQAKKPLLCNGFLAFMRLFPPDSSPANYHIFTRFVVKMLSELLSAFLGNALYTCAMIKYFYSFQ